ncbi:MAG TPA: TraR/DksA C4-type zinc finger protein [Candidatus Paceibacterota bacterium]|jgi:RNA polymerase-binding transcription factor DksA|nr:TraR/DksA C4-type zinc finger protein [Candidatus Paceibacterota bacterium]HRS47840.1 TraR/DksA C4-type zinc finger protein [Candidatus Paceibacterota bacterium]
MINQKTREELKKQLLAERKKIEKDLHSFTLEIDEAIGGHEVVIKQEREISPEDQAEAVSNLEKNKGIEAILEKRLAEIDHALEIIDSDKYGYCEVCGKEINLKRLKVNPAATTCIEHSS